MPDFRQNNGFATSATLPRHALQRARQFARRIICRMADRYHIYPAILDLASKRHSQGSVFQIELSGEDFTNNLYVGWTLQNRPTVLYRERFEPAPLLLRRCCVYQGGI